MMLLHLPLTLSMRITGACQVGTTSAGSQRCLRSCMRAVVRRCAPLLLYFLLYGLDTCASRQLGQTPAGHARSTGVGLFIPKPSSWDPRAGHTRRLACWDGLWLSVGVRGRNAAIVTQLVTQAVSHPGGWMAVDTGLTGRNLCRPETRSRC